MSHFEVGHQYKNGGLSRIMVLDRTEKTITFRLISPIPAFRYSVRRKIRFEGDCEYFIPNEAVEKILASNKVLEASKEIENK